MNARSRMVGMGVVIVLLLGGGFTLLLAATTAVSRASVPVFGFGTGLLAVSLGMRHAFDMDHISMIDNTTRALSRAGRRPLAVGFFFSLGHSTVVLVLTILVTLGGVALGGRIVDADSMLHRVAGVIGAAVSGGFLYAIVAVNLVVLVTVVRTSRREGGAPHVVDELRGPLSRVFSRASRGIDASWKIYPVGVLFGLGFDTATEIALLVVSAAAAVGGLPFWAVLSLPLLFAGGMCLFDTLDGWLMSAAYGWASDAPLRRLRYNVAITAMSIAVAFAIGTLELGGLLGRMLGWSGPIASAVANLDPGLLGLGITAVFAGVWAIAVIGARLHSSPQRGTTRSDRPQSLL